MDLVWEYLTLAISVMTGVQAEKTACFADFHREYNRKVTRMRMIANKIEQDHPELKERFCAMLTHECRGVRLWAAHHMLEVMNFPEEQRKAALRIIRREARTNALFCGFGERIWLKDWYRLHPKDRWLR